MSQTKKSNFVRNRAIAIGSALAVAAGTASADIGADITAAVTSGTANATAAAGGVIAIGALMLGVGVIMSLFRK